MYEEAELKQVFSVVYTVRTVQHIISGKDFEKALHGLELVGETVKENLEPM